MPVSDRVLVNSWTVCRNLRFGARRIVGQGGWMIVALRRVSDLISCCPGRNWRRVAEVDLAGLMLLARWVGSLFNG